MEIAMKLEYFPIGNNAISMNDFQNQLANLTLQLQDIKKGKEHRKKFWCTQCHIEGHTKDRCPYFWNYLLSGAPNPLSCGSIPSCCICQVYGHRHEDCGYMQKMVTKPTNLYCTFWLQVHAISLIMSQHSTIITLHWSTTSSSSSTKTSTSSSSESSLLLIL